MNTTLENEESGRLALKVFDLIVGLARRRSRTIDADDLAGTIICRLVEPANLGKFILWKSLIEAGHLPRLIRREVFSRTDRLVRKQQRVTPLGSLYSERERQNADPVEALIANEYVEGLPYHLRTICRLRLEGWQQSEIAGEIGRTERTVHYRVFELRERAKQSGRSPERYTRGRA